MSESNTQNNNDATLEVTVDIYRAAEMLNISAHATRQLVARGKIETVRVGTRVRCDINSVLTYYARKKGLPAWEEHVHNLKDKSFVSLAYASTRLLVQEAYVMRLIKKKLLDAYVTSMGDIMISVDSINVYLKTPEAKVDKDEI